MLKPTDNKFSNHELQQQSLKHPGIGEQLDTHERCSAKLWFQGQPSEVHQSDRHTHKPQLARQKKTSTQTDTVTLTLTH
jgi:hypothetical protein